MNCNRLDPRLFEDEYLCPVCGQRNIELDVAHAIDARGARGRGVRLVIHRTGAHRFLRDLDNALRELWHVRLTALEGCNDRVARALNLCDDDDAS